MQFCTTFSTGASHVCIGAIMTRIKCEAVETNPPIRYTFAPKHYRSVAVETECYSHLYTQHPSSVFRWNRKSPGDPKYHRDVPMGPKISSMSPKVPPGIYSGDQLRSTKPCIFPLFSTGIIPVTRNPSGMSRGMSRPDIPLSGCSF